MLQIQSSVVKFDIYSVAKAIQNKQNHKMILVNVKLILQKSIEI